MAKQKTDIDYHSNKTSAYMADALVSPSKADPISATPMYGLVGNSSSYDMDMEKKTGNSKALGLAFRDEGDGINSLHSETELDKPDNIGKHSVLASSDACDEAIERTEDRILLEQVETDAIADEEHKFQDYGDTYMEEHSCCSKASERYCQEKEDTLDGGSLCNVRTVGDVLLEATAKCEELIFHKNNTEHLDKETTNKDLTVETVDPSRAGVAIYRATDFTDDVSYEGQSTFSIVDPRSPDNGYMHGKYTGDLSAKKDAQIVVKEAYSSNKVLYELGKRDKKFKKKIALTVDTDLASSDAGSTDMTPDNCSQFSVECENGIKLYVDMKNKTSAEWMKTQSYEFCSSEQLHEHYPYVQTPSTQGHKISEDTDLVADKKIEPAKLTKSYVIDEGKAQNRRSAAGDCHLVHTSSRAGCFASTSPRNVTRKSEASRELRRMSSVLIPPHGANRRLSPLMSYGASRLSSPLISHGANGFASLSSEVSCSRPQTYDNHQIDQCDLSSERCMPTMALSSKGVQEVSVQSTAVDKELLREKKQSVFPKVMEMNETAVPYSDIEAGAAKCPSMNDAELEDVEMLDHELCDISDSKTYNSQSQQQQVARCQEERGQNRKKDTGRIMQIQLPEENSKTDVNCSTLTENFETKEKHFISRYKYDYKKLPFGKNLRSMKNLARVSSMRADILANRRSTPCMVSAYPHPCRSIECVHFVPQAAEERKGAPVSSLREKCKEVAVGSHSVLSSPIVYEESDWCDSVLSHSDTSQNPGSISISARVGREGNGKSHQSKQKLEGWPFLGFGRRRFLQRALADSARRLKAQKILRSGVYDRCVIQEEVPEEVLGDKKSEFSQEPNDTKLNMLESEQDLYSKRVTEKQRRHHEKFKTSLIGKSREKAKKIAKQMVALHRREILRSKRAITLTDMSVSDMQENLNHPLK